MRINGGETKFGKKSLKGTITKKDSKVTWTRGPYYHHREEKMKGENEK